MLSGYDLVAQKNGRLGSASLVRVDAGLLFAMDSDDDVPFVQLKRPKAESPTAPKPMETDKPVAVRFEFSLLVGDVDHPTLRLEILRYCLRLW